MISRTQTNLFLIISNIVALTYFTSPPKAWTYPFFLALTYFSIDLTSKNNQVNRQVCIHNAKNTQSDDTKLKMQIVSGFSIIAAFILNQFISDIFAVLALGLAINVGHKIDATHSPWAINCALGIGIILGFWSQQYTHKYKTARDIVLLVFTLPNIFIAQNSKKKETKKILYLINPFYDGSWAFSLGFLAGIFLPMSQTPQIIPHYSPSINRSAMLKKSTRYFLIALIMLILIFLSEQSLLFDILTILRGLLTYTQSKIEAELFFLVGFIFIKIFIPDILVNYMFIGYLVLGVILWQTGQNSEIKHKHRHRDHHHILSGHKNLHQRKNSLHQPLIQMQEIKNEKV